MDNIDFNNSVPEISSVIGSYFKPETDLNERIEFKDNMDTTLEQDIPGDLSNLDDEFGILHTCDNVFSNSNVIDCLSNLPPSQEQFEMPSIEEQALPVYGPLCEFETQTAFETQPIFESNVVDSNAVPGICGFRNLGNTCFMNAGLQCLLNNKIFKNYFVEGDFELTGKDSFTYQFAQLMKNVWSGTYSIMHLGEFKNQFGKTHSQFRNFRQHDCQEFLALLLDTMHEELNSINQSKLDVSYGGPDHHRNDCKIPSSSQTAESSVVTEDMEETCDEKLDETNYKRNDETMKSNASVHGTCLNTSLNVTSKGGTPENVLKNDVSANNAKPIKSGLEIVKKQNSCESDTLYERNTEKMADLLINNNKLDKILSKNCLEVTHNTSNESASKVNSAEKFQLSPTKSVSDSKIEKNELANKLNSVRKIPSIDDFVKDTKTLNTNMLVSDETNNLFKFDSEKFPKYESSRLQETVDNLGQIIDFGAKQSGTKRVKMTNIMHEKHKFLESSDTVSSSCFTLHKRLKTETMDSFECGSTDQEDIVEMEPMHDECSEESSQSSELNTECRTFSEEVHRAYNHWDKYKELNQSVIVDTFHGQFRSSVVCSQCSHVSITYEPFMYLPVFLPHALEKQIEITYVQNDGSPPSRYLVNVNKYERVIKMRESLQKLFEASSEEIVLAEVFENHISRILDDTMSIGRVNDSSRRVYAFEIGKITEQDDNMDTKSSAIPLAFDEETREPNSYQGVTEQTDKTETCDRLNLSQTSSPLLFQDSKLSDDMEVGGMSDCEKVEDTIPENIMSNGDSNGVTSIQRHSCTICLEDLPDFSLLFHPNCDCFLCQNCIEVSCKHYGGDSFICPVCSKSVTPKEDFMPLSNIGEYKFQISTIPIPIVFRNDMFEGDTLKSKTLVGHPGLLKLPSSLPAVKLYEHVDSAIPFISTYSLLLVDGQGMNCSRCLYNQHCYGCEISRSGDIKLQPGDSLAVRYVGLTPESLESTTYLTEHKSMLQARHKTPLDVYDCLESFSERERLDEDSPWYCPMCRQNRQATKSLSVWKFPEVLIICLKRFVFLDYSSMKIEEKVTYPLEGLDLSSFSSGPITEDLVYDLQACVCHFGGASAGHYTSYSKHALTNEWYYFNDENVKMEAPKIDECVNEYILFYQRR